MFTLVDTETGEARSRVIPNVTGVTLKRAVQAQVHRSSTLVADEHTGYIEATRNLEGHETVIHSKGVYSRDGGKISSNAVEGYFSQLKCRSTGLTTTSQPSIRPATWPNPTSATPLASSPIRNG